MREKDINREINDKRSDSLIVFSLCFVGGFAWKLTEFIIGVFLQVLGLPFVAVAQVSLFSKVTAEKTQGEERTRPDRTRSPRRRGPARTS